MQIPVSSISLLTKINNIAQNNNLIAKVHIKVDTGMNRFGVKDYVEFNKLLEVANALYNVSIVGIYSHFAVSDSDLIVNEQISTFNKFLSICHRKRFFPIAHISSSKRSNDKTFAYDMVRIGIDLYEKNDSIRFTGEVLEIKYVKKGEYIGYNYTYRAAKDMKIACINIGYGDISIRKLSNKGRVIINNKFCNIVGTICMDCLFADVSDIDVSVGDYAILFGKDKENCITICSIADLCDTISYELFTSISDRVKRIYK